MARKLAFTLRLSHYRSMPDRDFLFRFTEDEAFILSDFFGRFDLTDHFRFVHSAEYIAISGLAADLEKRFWVRAFNNPRYAEEVAAARERVAPGAPAFGNPVQPESGGTLRRAWNPQPAPAYLETLRAAIRDRHQADAAWIESLPTAAYFRRKRGWLVWDGTVELFELRNHPRAQRCYAFINYDYDVGEIAAVLEHPPVNSPAKAVEEHIEGARRKRRQAYGLERPAKNESET